MNAEPMTELSLFTGAGGGVLGTHHLLGWRTIGYVEWDDYCQQVIAARIRDGHLDAAPIFGDVREFVQSGAAAQYRGFTDVVTAGFPCQPYSSAARGRNKPGDGIDLLLSVVDEVEPSAVLAENVSKKAIMQAATGLRGLGYSLRGATVSAADVGADHIRKRHWLLAYTDDQSKLLRSFHDEVAELQEFRSGVWGSYPGESGVANGVASRVDRFRATGNGQVPLVAATAWRLLTQD